MSLGLENIPSPKEEAWKYTDLRRAVPTGLIAAPPEEPVIIHRNGGQNGGQPVEIMWETGDKQYRKPQLTIVLEQGAEMTLIERYRGSGDFWCHADVAIEAGPGAVLNHIRIMDDQGAGVTTTRTLVSQDNGSSYYGFYIIQNSRLMRDEVTVDLNGEGAQCELNGLNLLRGGELGDFTFTVNHNAPHGRSGQFVRSVIYDHARGVFQGKAMVARGADKTDARQLSKALLLSEGAEMDAKPELEIYADDVQCAHGATTGQLDEDALFYLRSRGVPMDEARGLLIAAFVDELVDKLADESVRSEIHSRVQAWLSEPHSRSREGGQRGEGL